MARVKTMTRRRFAQLSEEELVAAVPFRVKVAWTGWWLGLAIFAGGAWFFACVLFFSEGEATPMGQMYKALMWIGLPVCLFFLPVYVVGCLFPRHLTVTEEGLSTRWWSVSWLQVERISYTGEVAEGKVQALFRVSPQLWESGLREANRWDSGMPFGGGGLTRHWPCVRTQRNLMPFVGSLWKLFETLHHRAWERAGHVGGFDGYGPVVPDGRRAVAPNTPAEDEDPAGGPVGAGGEASRRAQREEWPGGGGVDV